MLLIVFIILFLNALFIASLRHLDINHHLIRLGKKQTQGEVKISPEKGYRTSQYGLIIVVLLLDLVVLYLLFAQ
jgi:hypothetical protein